jgi:hypothetical protein
MSGDFYSYTAKELGDMLERDYFPTRGVGGKQLYLGEHEWRLVIDALRQCGPNDTQDAKRYRWVREHIDMEAGVFSLIYDDYGDGELVDAEVDARLFATGRSQE